jgi:alanine-glyoxylate transaminase/serine-glyoxylate transaminase/serine-pyruvate transaminase
MAVVRGRNFFQNPGPTNIPDRILKAMASPSMDFHSAGFEAIAAECYAGLRRVFKTEGTILVYAASGHGAWEAALANTLSPGDRVLIVESGYFSLKWGELAEGLGLVPETVPGDWRAGADPAALEKCLKEDRKGAIKAVMLVHNETSTGVTNRVAEMRRAIDAAKHPALFLVDVISSLGTMDFRMDEWGVDVVVGGSQKGLMMPPGMAFTAVSDKALEASKAARLTRIYWDWRKLLNGAKEQSYYNGTAPVNLFYALKEALLMMEEEGLDRVFARHRRLAEASRRAVRAWRQNDGPETFAADPRVASESVTAILVPDGTNANEVRRVCFEKFNVSLGGGLGPLDGRVFRLGHMGDLNEPMILGAIAAIEMAFEIVNVPHGKGGVAAAMDYLVATA